MLLGALLCERRHSQHQPPLPVPESSLSILPAQCKAQLVAKSLGEGFSCFDSVSLTNDEFMLFRVATVNLGTVQVV